MTTVLRTTDAEEAAQAFADLDLTAAHPGKRLIIVEED